MLQAVCIFLSDRGIELAHADVQMKACFFRCQCAGKEYVSQQPFEHAAFDPPAYKRACTMP